jgi:hypothetical protein
MGVMLDPRRPFELQHVKARGGHKAYVGFKKIEKPVSGVSLPDKFPADQRGREGQTGIVFAA